MQGQSIKAAEKALRRARVAAFQLERAKTHDEAEDAWDDFLVQAAKVYEKLKAGTAGDPRSVQWFAKYRKERSDDPLLHYLQHARNADQHRADSLTDRAPEGIELRFDTPDGMPSGGFIQAYTEYSDGRIEFEFEPAYDDGGRPVLAPTSPLTPKSVLDRHGGVHNAPTQHLGETPVANTARDLATLAVTYLDAMVSDAPRP